VILALKAASFTVGFFLAMKKRIIGKGLVRVTLVHVVKRLTTVGEE
jgi:hypothetical protein